MKPARSRTALIVSLACAVSLLPCSTGVNAEELAGIEFQRTYVPADRPEQWPHDGHRYLPVERDNFARLLSTAGPASDRAPASTRFAEVRLEANLKCNGRLEGTARFVVAKPGAGSEPLALGGIARGMQDWKWELPNEAAPVVGTWQRDELAVLADRAGELSCRWTLSPSEAVGGSAYYDFDLPRSPQTTVDLHLPSGVTPEVAGGAVERLKSGQGEQRAWRILPGIGRPFVLRLRGPDVRFTAERLPGVDQRTSYEITPSTLIVESDFVFSAGNSPTELLARLDPSLQFVEARYRGQRVEASVEEDGQQTKVRLQLPSEMGDSEDPLTIHGVAPSRIGEAQRLPRVRIEGAFWQGGFASLSLASPLRIERLEYSHARQTQLSQTGTREFQLFRPDAEIHVSVAAARSLPVATRGISLGTDSIGLTGKLLVELRAVDRSVFEVTGTVARNWKIVAVENMSPGEPLENWQVSEDGETRQLRIRLAEGVPSGRAMQLLVRGYRELDQREWLSLDDLRMVQFNAASTIRDLISLPPSEHYQLQLRNDREIKRLTPEEMDLESASLLVDPPQGVLLEADSAARRLRARFLRRGARLQARTHITVEPIEQSVRQEYLFRIEPDEQLVESIVVQFQPSSDAAPRHFRIVGTRDHLPADRLGPDELESAGLPLAAEAWRVLLPRPTPEPVELVTEQTVKRESTCTVPLAGVVDAAEQEGRLEVRAARSVPIQIDTNLAPWPGPAARSPSALRSAWYRFDPADGIASGQFRLSISADRSQSHGPAAWAWGEKIFSRFDADGRASHLLVHELENQGSESVSLVLPKGLQLQSVSANGRPVVPRLIEEERGFEIYLPPAEQFVTLTLSFLSRSSTSGGGWLQSPFVRTSYPVLQRNWSVALPPGFVILSASASRQGSPMGSWSERLLGPLARHSGSYVLANSTWSRHTATSREASSADDRAALALESLVQGVRQENRGGRLRWKELLDAWALELAAESKQLFVDPFELARLQIEPHAIVNGRHLLQSIDDAAQFIERVGGVVLLLDDRVVLMSRAGLAGRPVVPTSWPSVVTSADSDRRADEPWGASSLMFPEAWSATTAPAIAPWKPEDGAGRPTLAELDAAFEWSDVPPALFILRADQLLVLCAAVALLGAYCAYLIAALGVSRLGVLLGASAGLALFSPAELIPLTSSTFLGTVVGGMAGISKSWILARRLDRSAARPGISSLAILLFCCLPGQVAADEPIGDQGASTRPFRVLVPVDENRQAAGDTVYLPAEMLESLERIRDEQAARAGFLITKAYYELRLREEDGKLAPQELMLVYHLHLLGPRLMLPVPLPRGNRAWQVGDATLAGQPVAIEETGSQAQLVAEVGEPGEYELRVTMAPAGDDLHADLSSLELAIPPVPNSRLVVVTPDQHARPRLLEPSIELQLENESVSREREYFFAARLGTARRLVVEWTRNVLAERSQLGVDELYWLRVNPGSVMLVARFRFDPAAARPDALTLQVDSNLQLLPSTQFLVSSLTPGRPSSDGKFLRLELQGEASEAETVEASFLVTDNYGVGNVRFPQVRLVNRGSNQRRLAVSIADSLQHEAHSTSELDPLASADFLKEWGPGDESVDLAYRIPAHDFTWFVSVAPKPILPTAEQTLHFSLGEDLAEVVLNARVDATGARLFQQSFRVPAEIEVENVSLVEEGVERVAYWARNSAGQVHAFLTSPVSGPCDVEMTGRLNVANLKKVAVPSIRLEGTRATVSQVFVYRRSAVSVAVAEVTGAQELGSARFDERYGRPVRAFHVDGEEFSIRCTLAPNQPEVTGAQVLRLPDPVNPESAVMELVVDVQRGLLDSIQVQVPIAWERPVIADAEARVDWVETPGDSTRRAVIWPAEPIRGRYRVRLERWKRLAGEADAIPWARMTGLRDVDSYLILSTGKSGTTDWSVAGAQEEKLPEGLFALEVPAGDRVFRVLRRDYQLVREFPSQQIGLALVEHQVRVVGDREASGVSTFELLPAGHRQCDLLFTRGFEPIQVFVDQMPARAEKRSDRHWRVMLRSTEFPQRLEVVFRGPSARLVAGRRVAAPVRLLTSGSSEPAVADRALWVVQSPDFTPSRTSAVDLAARRLRATEALINRAIAEGTRQDLEQWLPQWLDYWSDAAQRVAVYAARRDGSTAVADTIIRQTALDQAQLQEELLDQGLAIQLPRSDRHAEDATNIFEMMDPAAGAYRAEQTGGGHYLDLPPDSARHRRFASFAVPVLIGMIPYMLVWGLQCDFVFSPRNSAPALLAVAGIAWWLWLTPAWIGILIAGWAVLQSLPMGWRLPAQDSSLSV